MQYIILLLSVLLTPLSHAIDWLDSAEQLMQPAASSSAEQAAPASGGLSDMLVQGLGVTQTQASGGLGSLFSLAQSTLTAGDFSSLRSAVPGMGGYLAATPASGDSGGLMGTLGQLGGAAGAASTVAQQFSSLGLDAAMIPQYIDTVSRFLQSSGGQQSVELFKKGIAALL